MRGGRARGFAKERCVRAALLCKGPGAWGVRARLTESATVYTLPGSWCMGLACTIDRVTGGATIPAFFRELGHGAKRAVKDEHSLH